MPRSNQRKTPALSPPISHPALPDPAVFPTFEAYLAYVRASEHPGPPSRTSTPAGGRVGFWSGSWPPDATNGSPPSALPDDSVGLLLFAVRIVTDEPNLTISEMASPAYAGPVSYVRTIIDTCDIFAEIPHVLPGPGWPLSRTAPRC